MSLTIARETDYIIDQRKYDSSSFPIHQPFFFFVPSQFSICSKRFIIVITLITFANTVLESVVHIHIRFMEEKKLSVFASHARVPS